MTRRERMATQRIISSLLAVPPIIYFVDSFYSVKKIQGNSMEDNIRDGDIVLIRKVDFFPHYFKHKLTLNDLVDDENGNLVEDNDIRKSLRMDASAGKPAGDALTLWRSPPIILPGDVISFTSPQAMEKTEMKRVLGIGGQRIRPKKSLHKIEYLGAYHLWVEHDNATSTSGYTGPVSKKLVDGIVDRIIWPPSRMGRVHRIRPPLGRNWWP